MHLPTVPGRRIAPAALTIVALAFAGCGDSSDDSPTTSGGSTASTASTPSTASTASTSSSPAADPDRAKLAPKDLLKQVTASLEAVKNYHVEGTQTDAKDGEGKVSGDIQSDGSLLIDLTQKGFTLSISVVDKVSYLKADRGFWASSEGGDLPDKVADALGGKWVIAPSGDDSLSKSIDPLLPKTLAFCADKDIGTLEAAGTKDVDGQPAIVIKDKGDKPGSEPGEIYIAASGRPLPVRLVQTGKRKAGGLRPERCQEDDDTSTAGDFRLSKFDEVAPITAPKDAKKLEDLVKSAAGSSVS